MADSKSWHLGAFLGLGRRTGQYVLYDGEPVNLVRELLRRADANKWDKEALPRVTATPWSFHTPRDLEIVQAR